MKKQAGLTLMEFLVVAACVGIVFWLGSLVFGPEARAEVEAERKAKEAQRIEDAKPRKVSEANGCEVWAFNPGGRWQYFTRCGAATQTTNTWDECRSVTSGKTTRQECTPHSLTITQEPKQ